MSQTRYYVEYILTGTTQNALLKVEDNLYIRKQIGVGTGNENAIGVKIVPETALDVAGQIRVSSGSTYYEGEIRYLNKYLWINTGGTSTSWVPLGTGGGGTLSATTDSNFFYDDTSDTLYTLYLNLSGATGSTAHPTNYYGLFIDRDTGLVYSNDAGSSSYDVWTLLSSSLYTATPAATSAITFTGTIPDDLVAGSAIRWRSGATATYFFDQVLTKSASQLGLRGAPLGNGACISELYYSKDRGMIHTEFFIIPGNYADNATNYLLQEDMFLGNATSPGIKWFNRGACLVGMGLIHDSNDTGTVVAQPALTPYMVDYGGDLFTYPLTASTSWVQNGINVNVSRYEINYGYQIEIRVARARGTIPNHDASDLNGYLIFVMDNNSK